MTAATARMFRRREGPRSLRTVSLALLAAASLGGMTIYAISTGRTLVAIAVAILPLAIWEFASLSVALVMLGASLPLLMNIASVGSPVNVAVSDLLLAFLTAGIAAAAIVGDRVETLRAIRPLRPALLPYGLFVIVLLPIHFGFHEVLQTAQRFELFLIPVVVGAYAVLTRRHLGVLTAYVVATTVFAAVWPVDSLAIQKNPAGQLEVNAILLLIAYRPLRRLTPCLLILVPGLFLTQSRGAVAALVIGGAVVALMHPERGKTVLMRLVPLLLVGIAAFALLSSADQKRLTTLSAGTGANVSPGNLTAAQYPIYIRQQYSRDARRLAARHPLTGIGVGNYLAGNSLKGTLATDPHNVILLQAAEGGYGFAAVFIILVAGSAAILYRLRRIDLAPAAAAVLLATAVHGLVDVYWVRGTPVLGWLLVGMACGALAQERKITTPE